MEQIDTKSANKSLIISGIVIAIFVIGLITNGFGLFPTGQVVKNEAIVALAIGNSPVLGSADAPVTIYEFSDLSCPYCAAANGDNQPVINQLKSRDKSWTAPLPEIKKKYVNTGKVKIVFKYSLGHGTGEKAQIIAYALNEQGLFWKFTDAAFANQQDVNDVDKMKALAKSLGANMTQLDESLASGKYNSQLVDDTAMGKSSGIAGTPSFIINGKIIEGAQTFSAFEKVIDAELVKVN